LRPLGNTLRKGSHLAALSALALAQPVLDILGKNPAFFAVRGSTGRQIVVFAIAITLGVPAVLLLVELLARAVSPRLADALHLLFVAALAALFALLALTRTEALTDGAAIAAAAAFGVLAAAAYRSAAVARSFLTVLAPVPLVFLALFVFNTPVSDLVFEAQPAARAAAPVTSRTPVVLIVFDEFTTSSLMDRRERIDAVRFPSFASLAGDSTWFRSATTAYWLSEVAVPTVFSGLEPDADRLPIASKYPNSIFTLLGESYRVRAIETLTRLCPRDVCGETQDAQTHAVPNTASSLASDVGTVYLHLLLPEPYVDRVPPIDDSWGNFGRDAGAREDVQRGSSGALDPCGRNVCRFAELIDRDPRPTLYVLHALLPHVPYVYIPSGRRYAVDSRLLRGLDNGYWQETWPALQGYQRYLLQLGYTDRALGLILRRLRETGVYDRALLIVTADHGVGFRLGSQRRVPLAANLDEIAFVPLFVKLPGQRTARIDDAPARNLDVVPTIARVLGLKLPWRAGGRPLVGSRSGRGRTVTVVRNDRLHLSAPLSTLLARRARTVSKQVSVFGTGSLDRVYRIGPHRELLGRSVSSLAVLPAASGTRVTIDDRQLLDSVDRTSGFVPVYLEGRLFPDGVRNDLAIALNGKVAAVTKTFDQHGQTRFTAMVREDALQNGRNAVEIFRLDDAGGSVRLVRLRGSDLSFSLLNGGSAIGIGARSIPVRAGALRGVVRARREQTGWVFSGWAAQRSANLRVDTLVVFVGDRAVYTGRAVNLKPQAILGQPELGKTGFEFELPPSLLPAADSSRPVRVFALHARTASELRYDAAFPWR
jgi:sulfatase-like protein